MKKKLTLLTCLAATLLIAAGCKDATMAQFNSLGSKHKITMYSGGKVVGTWESTGNVSNEEHSDGWYFEDAQTHKLVELTGQLVIEQE